jgi:hypothetical protein
MKLFTPLPPNAKPYVVTAVGPDDLEAAPARRGPAPAGDLRGRLAAWCGGLAVPALAALLAIAVPVGLVALLLTPFVALLGLAVGLPGLLRRRGRRAALRGVCLSAAALVTSCLTWGAVLVAIAGPLD